MAETTLYSADHGYETGRVRRARFKVGRITQKEHKLHLLQVEVERLQRELIDDARSLKVDLTEAKRHGDAGWSEAWVGYWLNIGCPCYERKAVAQ